MIRNTMRYCNNCTVYVYKYVAVYVYMYVTVIKKNIHNIGLAI